MTDAPRFAVYRRRGRERRWRLVDVFDDEDAAWAEALAQPGHVWIHKLDTTAPDLFTTSAPHEVPTRLNPELLRSQLAAEPNESIRRE